MQGKIDASDVVQETFIQACRTFRQFEGTTEKELLSWLRRVLAHVLSNTVRHYYGAKRRDVRLEQEVDHELDRTSQVLNRGFFDRRASPSEQAVRREQSVLLANALERLPDDYREALILRHLEELRFPDVAERMGRSQDSVKKLWARGLACLRRAVEAEQ